MTGSLSSHNYHPLVAHPDPASIRYPDHVKKPIETEIKLRIEGPVKAAVAKARALLRRHGFGIIAPRIFEQNLVLDDERSSLRERSMLLRLRGAGKVVTCTFKGPEMPGRHKSREEREFRAGDLDSCVAVFAALGFREAFRYEKYRTEFARDNEPGHATLDETPIGVFMELEGPARWIDRTAKELGFPVGAYITESYVKLYENWCEESGIKATGMRFVKPRRG
jgi:adenylate cyclase class 2